MDDQRCQVIEDRKPNGRCPIIDFLKKVPIKERPAVKRVIVMLEKEGHTLLPPYTKHLRDKIHELRPRGGRSQVRVLYFLVGSDQAVLTNGVIKSGKGPVDPIVINQAIEFREDYLSRHSEDNNDH